jgi:hypothetical protein
MKLAFRMGNDIIYMLCSTSSIRNALTAGVANTLLNKVFIKCVELVENANY